MKGIDVSNNNGAVNWKQVAASGVQFAWCKASEGTWFRDSFLHQNLNGARAFGVHVGAYHYARPDRGTVAEAEANFFLDQVGKIAPGDLLPVLDLEVTGVSRASMTNFAIRFMDHVKRQSGHECVLYTYPYFLHGNLDVSKLKGRKLWYADYTGVPGQFTYASFAKGMKIVAQQYSSSGAVPGVHGRCDMNFAKALAPISVPSAAEEDDFWTWLRWNLGEGEFAKYGPRKGPRPNVPKRIPAKWWRKRKKFLDNRKKG